MMQDQQPRRWPQGRTWALSRFGSVHIMHVSPLSFFKKDSTWLEVEVERTEKSDLMVRAAGVFESVSSILRVAQRLSTR